MSGTMVDERTSWTESVREMLDGPKLDDQSRRIIEEWARVCPDAILTTTLARDSRLSGQVLGDRIKFTKQYAHPQESVWSGTGVETIRQIGPRSPIVYSGTLSPNGAEIEGVWRIYTTAFFGLFKKLNAMGKFRLTRGVNSGSNCSIGCADQWKEPSIVELEDQFLVRH